MTLAILIAIAIIKKDKIMSIITTTEVNSILTVRNPASNSTALTITPLA